jgi:hypothetical protein
MITLDDHSFQDYAPCSLLKVKRRFGGTYRIRLQGKKIMNWNEFGKEFSISNRVLSIHVLGGTDEYHETFQTLFVILTAAHFLSKYFGFPLQIHIPPTAVNLISLA